MARLCKQFASEVRSSCLSALLIALPVIWLIIMLWQSIGVFVPAFQLTEWLKRFSGHSGYGIVWLLVGIATWIIVLCLLRLKYPRYLPFVLVAELVIICGGLLITSQQGLAALSVLWLGLVAWLIGFTTLNALKVHLDPLEKLILAPALGLGALAVLTLILGLAGILEAAWVLGGSTFLAIILAFASRRTIQTWARDMIADWQSLPSPSWLALACLILLSIFVLINWIGALAPEVRFDALKSHLALTKIYATDHRVTGVPYSIESYWPMNGEMLFTLGYLLAGETAAKLFHFGAGVLAAGMVYVAGKRLDSRLTGLIAATIFFTTPVIAWEANTADIDLFLAMFSAGALLMMLIWLNQQRTWQIAAGTGLFLGFGMGIKPIDAYFAIAVGLVMLYAAWRRRATRGWSDFRSVIAVTLVTALVGGIWYLRAFLLTGNPVFPFMNGVFRSPLWYPRNETFNFNAYGFGTTLPALVLLPLRLTFDSVHFSEMANGATGILFLAFVPLVVLAPKLVRRLWAVIFVILFFGIAWAFSAQYLRYYIPAMSGLALIGSSAMLLVGRILKEQSPKLAWTLPTFFVVLASMHAPLMLFQYQHSAMDWLPYDVVLGHTSREQFRANRIRPYKTYIYSNAHVKKTAKIFAVGEPYQYLSELPLITPFFTVEGDKILYADSETSLSQALAASGITYLLINQPAVEAGQWKILVDSKPFLTDHAVLQYVANHIELYRLLAKDEQPPPPAENLLTNNGFEEVNPDGSERGWYMYGKPLIDRTGTHAHSGQVAIEVDSRDWLTQEVPVKPDNLYTLGHWTRSDRPGQLARLQVNWVNNRGKLFDDTVELISTTDQWQWHEMSISAPKGAAFADVYASVQESSKVWFDDIRFVNGDR